MIDMLERAISKCHGRKEFLRSGTLHLVDVVREDGVGRRCTPLSGLQNSSILYNLLSNAVKFTPLGGEISVTAVHNESSVRGIVADTGIVIPRMSS